MNGGFIAAGYAKWKENLPTSPMLVKYDVNGNMLWAVTELPYDVRRINDVCEDANGNICVVASKSRVLFINGEYIEEVHRYIFIYDAKGKLLRDKEISDMVVSNVVFLKDSSIVLCGMTQEKYYKYDHDGMLRIYNSKGELVFNKIFQGNGDERFNNVLATSDGGFLVTGTYINSTEGAGFLELGVSDPEGDVGVGTLLLKYDSKGNLQNKYVFKYLGNALFITLLGADKDGGAYVSFYVTDNQPGRYFIDPITNQKVYADDYAEDRIFLYRIESSGKLERLYVIKTDELKDILRYTSQYRFVKASDGSLRFALFLDLGEKYAKVLEIVDKYEISKALESTSGLKAENYTKASWDAFAEKLKAANNANAGASVSQKQVNDVTAALISAKNKLVKAATTPTATATPTSAPSATPTAPPTTKTPTVEPAQNPTGATTAPAASTAIINTEPAQNRDTVTKAAESVATSKPDSTTHQTEKSVLPYVIASVVIAGGAGAGIYLAIKKK